MVRVLKPSFADTMAAVPTHESTPPLYYALAWFWTQLFGTSEFGLRSLSAVIGTATVPVVYLAGRELVSRRTGLIAAAITAVAPWMVWYSQEGRSYPLLMLLGAVSLLYFARSLKESSTKNLGFWALSSALALATHYFAAFLVVPEAIWLLYRLGRDHLKRLVASLAVIAASAAALAPLALDQAGHGYTDWIGDYALSYRTKEIVVQFIAGGNGNVPTWLSLLVLLVIGMALWLLLRADPQRQRAALPAALALSSVAIPFVLLVGGQDYVLARNLAVAWIPFAIVIAAGLAAGPRRLAIPVGVGLCGLLLALTVASAIAPKLQRMDWRAAAKLAPGISGGEVIVLPFTGGDPIKYYADAKAFHGTQRVRTIILLGWKRPGPAFRPPRGFERIRTDEGGVFTVVTLKTQSPRRFSRGQLYRLALDPVRSDVLRVKAAVR